MDIVQEKANTFRAAIAKAEGWHVLGSLPQRINNPGDMKLGDRGWGIVEGKTVYLKADFAAPIDDKADGAAALWRECLAMLSGASPVYYVNDTFALVASSWTGGDNTVAWMNVVCSELGVTPNTTLRQYVLQGD